MWSFFFKWQLVLLSIWIKIDFALALKKKLKWIWKWPLSLGFSSEVWFLRLSMSLFGSCCLHFLFFSLLFSTGGSDSSVSDGLPMHIIYAAEGLKMVSTIAILNKKLQEKSSKDKWLGMPTKTICWTLVFVTTKWRNASRDPPGAKEPPVTELRLGDYNSTRDKVDSSNGLR